MTEMTTPQTFVLSSEDLLSKWGFADGDLLDDLLYENGIGEVKTPDDWHLTFHHEVLARVVERYLLPELDPRPAVERICTIHNPIRVTDEWAYHPDMPDGVEVVVTTADVLQIATSLKAEISTLS